jgi:uncharacterized membrane protein YdbT with pleckstrin-like domain
MGYVENNLMPDEQVVYTGHVHAFSLAPGLITTIFGAALVLLPTTHPQLAVPGVRMFLWIGGGFFFLSGLWHLLVALARKATTELALTTRRIIAKSGIIMREVTELNYSRVESFTVDQSILGMVFGYGTFFIHGVGGSKSGIRCIAHPMQLRHQALEMLDKASNQGGGKG